MWVPDAQHSPMFWTRRVPAFRGKFDATREAGMIFGSNWYGENNQTYANSILVPSFLPAIFKSQEIKNLRINQHPIQPLGNLLHAVYWNSLQQVHPPVQLIRLFFLESTGIVPAMAQ